MKKLLSLLSLILLVGCNKTTPQEPTPAPPTPESAPEATAPPTEEINAAPVVEEAKKNAEAAPSAAEESHAS